MHSTPEAQRVARGRTLYGVFLLVFVATAGWLVGGRHLSDLAAIGVSAMQPRFIDAYVVSTASVALEQGLDPLVHNVGDPLGRPLNYPRLWLVAAKLGLGPDDTMKLVLALFAAFGAGCVLLWPLARSVAISIVLAVALFSPVTWLAIERGNTDLLMFGLVAAAAWFAARRPAVASLFVGAAAALKLYPIFAAAGLWTDAARRTLRTALPLVALFLGYLWWIRSDLELVLANTYHWKRISYGIDLLPQEIATRWGWSVGVLLVAAAIVLLCVVSVGVAVRCRARLGAAATPHSLAAFRAGAAVFVGTFCSGDHFDYRLVFLLLVVPQCTMWAAAARGAVRFAAWCGLGALLAVMWGQTWQMWLRNGLGSEVVPIAIDELFCWTVCVGLMAGLVLSLPDWLLPASRRGAPFLDGVGDAPRSVGAAVLPLPVDLGPGYDARGPSRDRGGDQRKDHGSRR